MARHENIIRTADVCDDFGDDLLVCELDWKDYAGRSHFHGEVVTFATYEDNQGLREILARGGEGKVLVVDGRGSRRRALCGGNIAAEAHRYGWRGMLFNGCIRDSHECAELGFGLKAIGSTAMPPRKQGIGVEGAALFFGGIVIKPGDYLYADQDAVIVLKRAVHNVGG